MHAFNYNKNQINTLCKNHNVDELFIFGSAVSDRFSNESDVDVLVKFKPMDLFYYFENYISLKENLEKVFQREVDLVEAQTLKNPILIQNIEQNNVQIYG